MNCAISIIKDVPQNLLELLNEALVHLYLS